MTDTKPKDVCDTVDCGRAVCGYVCVCVCLQRCQEVLEVLPFSCYSMTREPSPVFSAESLDLTLGPRIGAYRPTDRDVMSRGSGRAVPRIGT